MFLIFLYFITWTNSTYIQKKNNFANMMFIVQSNYLYKYVNKRNISKIFQDSFGTSFGFFS
jgi:hypothetical protein